MRVIIKSMKKQYYVPVFAIALSLTFASLSKADETTSTNPGGIFTENKTEQKAEFRNPSETITRQTDKTTQKKSPLENENTVYYRTASTLSRTASSSANAETRSEQIKEAQENTLEQLKVKREQFQERMREIQDQLKNKLDKKENELKTKLQKIKDEKKKNIVEKLNKQIDERNSKTLEQYSKVLEQLETVLGKIEARANKAAQNGTDVSGVKSDMVLAAKAIQDARVAIEVQSKNVYKLDVTIEKNLATDMGKTRQQMKNDLEKVRNSVVKARQAVQQTAITLGQAVGITISPAPSLTPSPSTTPSPSVSATPSPTLTPVGTTPSPAPVQ